MWARKACAIALVVLMGCFDLREPKLKMRLLVLSVDAAMFGEATFVNSRKL